MRKTMLFLMLALSLRLFAQNPVVKEVPSTVSEVTVYLENALETRKASVDVPAGKTVLKFTGLSPFVDAKTVQARVNGEVIVLSVNHQQNFMDTSETGEDVKTLLAKLKEINAKIETEKALIAVLAEDMEYLRANRDLKGTQTITVAAVREGADFFSSKMTALKLKELERNTTLENLEKSQESILNQLSSNQDKKVFATGEILIQVDAAKAATVKVELSYLVAGAGWYPTYDLRVNNVTDPLQVVFKANIRQDTKGDWKNVRLRLSSYNPTVSGVAPELKIYSVGYGLRPPVYGRKVTSVYGRVTDQAGKPLAGVNVRIKDESLTTATDGQGTYSLTLPDGKSELEFSLIGYKKQFYPVIQEQLNVTMNEANTVLKEVVVKKSSTSPLAMNKFEGIQVSSVDEALQGRIAGLDIKNNSKIRGTASIPEQKMLQTPLTVEFEVKEPYTVLSDNKIVSVDMSRMEIPVQYQYYAVPKLNKDVFLSAQIKDWQQYSFLEGEANVFLEGAFVGKTLLNLASSSDTLNLTLGRDRKIMVQREKVRSFNSRQFLGSKQVDNRDWRITVRNTRSEKVNLLILDQIPVSTSNDIEVTSETSPKTAVRAEDGQVRWDFTLDAGKTQVLDLKYNVRYPKGSSLLIE